MVWALFEQRTNPPRGPRRQSGAIEPACRLAGKELPADCPAKRAGIRLDRLSFCNSSPRCARNRFENLHVTCAAAKITRKSLSYICESGLRVFFEQVHCRKNHSRRADAALPTTAFEE